MDVARGQAPQDSSALVAEIVRHTVDAIRAQKNYKELITTYEGYNAVVGILGLGYASITVSDGEVYVDTADELVVQSWRAERLTRKRLWTYWRAGRRCLRRSAQVSL